MDYDDQVMNNNPSHLDINTNLTSSHTKAHHSENARQQEQSDVCNMSVTAPPVALPQNLKVLPYIR
jgi:2-oxoglutarate dehydrogenase complex dehydrogenase (E1) component-like enzyme